VAKAKVTDVTGRQREEQLKAHAEELAQRAGEISMATAAAAARLETEVVDVSKNPDTPTVIDEIESVGVSMADDTQIVRLAEDLEHVTIGVGKHYSFKAGQKYKVPKHVAQHLQEKGYLYERL
jgi:Icc-related predicted phosphoesterase